ncbi:S-Ena type endospore appendage [Paenibacillus sp. IHBB 10380]|uniref:S-Ena type endospore appendage n=1 Tax=Paenibacillus sp. IHBB 10380 TaxID=1566358 RepID=UPI0040409A0A
MAMKFKSRRTIRCKRHSKKRKLTINCPRRSSSRKRRCRKKENRLIKKLICIHKCVPIKQACDNSTTQTYFCVSSNSFIKSPSGTITILNTSKSCTMQIMIQRSSKSSNDHDVADVGPNSSFTTIVSNAKSVKILCKGQSNHECTGSLELDIHYIALF